MDSNVNETQVNITDNPLADSQPHPDQPADTSSSRHSRKVGSLRSVKKAAINTTKRAFKVDSDEEKQLLWSDRRSRLLTRTGGKPKKSSHSIEDVDVPDAISDGEYYRDPAWRIAYQGVSKATGSIRQKFSSQDRAIESRAVPRGGTDEIDGLKEEAALATLPIRPKPKCKDLYEDHRPFFTYFIITSQTIILLLSLLVYGFGPVGIFSKTRSEKVLVPSLSFQQVDYEESQNIWLGPPTDSLIHMGAKFTPCMRYDRHVFDHINRERDRERSSACCIRSDESGCVQTTKDRCSDRVSVWKKWTPERPGPFYRDYEPDGHITTKNRTSGTVCGQDPRFCNLPASKPPYEWPDDITKWPICIEPVRPRLSEPHVSCEIIGRPCCFGIYGQCEITTQEYCHYVKGYFHEEATLCSQVSCMNDVCGLFRFDNFPNQWYRVLTSLFIHAGIVHLGMSVLFYYFYMRPIESYLGPLRTSVIYIFSGVGGNLLSAAFIPYRAEVGPAGSIMGMMSCLLVIIWYAWDRELDNPQRQLWNKLGVTGVFFFCGLFLPWIDNYAHLGGFLIGCGLSVALVPYVTCPPSDYEEKKKWITIAIGIFSAVTFFIVFILILYVFPIYDGKWWKYFNCIGAIFDDDFCADQDIKVTRVDVL